MDVHPRARLQISDQLLPLGRSDEPDVLVVNRLRLLTPRNHPLCISILVPRGRLGVPRRGERELNNAK